MKKFKSMLAALLCLLASVGLVLSGCNMGSSDSSDSEPTPSPNETDSGVIELTAPETAGTVTLVADSAPSTALYTGTSVQGALEVLMGSTYASSTDAFTISVAKGTYEEMLFYTGSATITIEGTGTATYGTDVVITYANSGNSNAMADLASSHGVTSGYTRGAMRFDGKVNLVLKNITLQNSYSRGSDTSNTQAEALVFTSTGNLIAYNSTFLSHQDTLYLGNKGGRMWFYKDYIAGDVDFIWGYMDVALFEECSIYCRGDEKTTSYIFASRSMDEDAVNKGIVIYNCDIEIGDGVTGYYGRNSGSDTTAAILNNTITGTGTLAAALYGSAPGSHVTDAAGDLALGYKDYNNTFNGTLVDTSSRLTLCEELSERVANREYNGRYVILNRGYNTTDEQYETASTIWDISDYEKEFGASEDTSNTNVYVDPVYAKNIVGGNTVQLTPSSDVEGLTYTYASSDISLATVDANGLVTTLAGADGTVVITVTGTNGNTDTMSVKVIPTDIPATALTVTLADASVAKYGVTTATITFEPTDASNQSFTLTSADSNVLFFDSSTQKLASSTTVEADDGTATVSVWVGGDVTNATLTAKSDAYESATAGTATVSTTAGAVTWGDTGAWRVATDIQSGKYGIYDGLVIDSEADDNDLISTDGKMSLKTNSKMQTRNVTLYIPVEGASTVTINMASSFESTDSLYFSVGSASSSSFTASDDNLTYTYTYDGGATGIVFGSDVTTAVTGTLQKQAGTGIVSDGKYLKVNVVGGDRYIQTIDVVKTGDFNADAFAVAATAVSVSPSTANVTVGDTTTLAAALTPSDSTDSVTWSSSNESVATVDADGVVTGVKAGTATITATAGSVTGTATITVSNATVAATAISLDASTATVEVKDTVTLVATVTPADSTDSVTWTSSNESVATVASGVVTGVKAGKATITAKAGDYSAECEVTVVAYASGTYTFADSSVAKKTALDDGTSSDGAVTWSGLYSNGNDYAYTDSSSKITISVSGSSIVKLTGCYSGTNGKTLTVVDSDNNTIVSGVYTSSDETLTFLYTGDATTLTITWSGFAYITAVQVSDGTDATESISSVKVSGTSELAVGDTVTYTATVAAAYITTDTSVTWSSSNESAATVDSDGVVTALSAGNTTITATSVFDSSVYGSIDVEVSASVSDTFEESTTISFGSDGNYSSLTKLDISNATIRDNGTNNSQISSGYISFKVKSGAVISVSSYSGYTSYTLSDGTTTSDTQTGTSYEYTATSDCSITLTAVDSNNYLYSISIVYPISEDTFFDLRTLFSELATSGTASSGSTDGLTYSAMYYKDSQHGAWFYKTSTLSFVVSGACTIYLGKDQYNGATFTVSDGTNSSELTATASSTLGTSVTTDLSDDSENPSFSYTGTSVATITISVTGQSKSNYLPALQVKF